VAARGLDTRQVLQDQPDSTVDAAGTGGLLAQVESRASAATIKWLNAQPEYWRAGITHVAIDLSAAYAKTVRDALSAAVLVADRFHVGSLANDMLTQVRQRIIRETRAGAAGRPTRPGPTGVGC